jgi:sterol desaturase/sphingolipid hydroxylase (fatty acid hydroxylase superfamily)
MGSSAGNSVSPGCCPDTVDFDGDLLVGNAVRDRRQRDRMRRVRPTLSSHGDTSMSLGTILLIILVIALLGGFTGFGGGYGYGFGHKSMGVLGTVLIIILILVLLGRI